MADKETIFVHFLYVVAFWIWTGVIYALGRAHGREDSRG